LTEATPHVPVMLDEAVEGLDIRADGIYIDATYGNGGHSRAILSRLSGGRLIALDVDPSVQPLEDPSFVFVRSNFRALGDVLAELNIPHIDGVLFDFGVSSMQLDQGERGFSFQQDAPLDMRMDPTQGQSAYELLQTKTETELADILFHFGEERASRRIARSLIRLRELNRLPTTTFELAACVSGTVHRPGFRERIHPATRTFQALRIAVNEELAVIQEGLDAAIAALKVGGRVSAISFHSLEDRIVKRCFRDDERVRAITRKPMSPTEAETDRNPRARSARLRIAERVEAA
jgi:16S rRNA (cytosine1402-N4)-methyltransferase